MLNFAYYKIGCGIKVLEKGGFIINKKGITRQDMFVHDMVHNNPGLEKYETKYTDPLFLKKRNYDGKVFELFDCAQYGLLWDKFDSEYHMDNSNKIFPIGSKARKWVEKRKQELLIAYNECIEVGIEVYFMMDIIVLPATMKQLYPDILNEKGRIDILKTQMKLILDALFDEIFTEFPQVNGIYIRYGETYVGKQFNTPYHIGNNPIQGDNLQYHQFLIKYLIEKICKEKDKKIFYRSWGFGSFQADRNTYINISDDIEPHKNLYFCIKHTAGDFHRTAYFNQCLNAGKHQQVIEVQAAREYEGKGAYPNYIADGVINGFEEYKWLMKEDEPNCLKDIVNVTDSRIVGIWTWSRGGGWDGPYINGKNGINGSVEVEKGSELWADINAYVISHWAKDTSKSDKYYALQYAREELFMDERNAEIFYEICVKSAHAVLLGRGKNTNQYDWNVFWTRDQNVDYIAILSNIKAAIRRNCLNLMLDERARSVGEWKAIVNLANSISDNVPQKEYIVTTCQYGYILYQLYETIYKANAYHMVGDRSGMIEQTLSDYDRLWNEWEELFANNKGCPTLFEKEDKYCMLFGYNTNKGLDSAINPIKQSFPQFVKV